jgi:hypothetical protein
VVYGRTLLLRVRSFIDRSELFAVKPWSVPAVRSLSVDPQSALEFAFAGGQSSLAIQDNGQLVSTWLLWNKGERIEIVDGDWPHPGTQACGEVERDQPPKMIVVEPAAPFQAVHHIIAPVEVRRSY